LQLGSFQAIQAYPPAIMTFCKEEYPDPHAGPEQRKFQLRRCPMSRTNPCRALQLGHSQNARSNSQRAEYDVCGRNAPAGAPRPRQS
jgi:hypothetical protein